MKYFFILLISLLASCSTSEPDPIVMLNYSYSQQETDMIDLVNHYRTDHYLASLYPVEHISALCKQNNDLMIQTGVPGHHNFQYRINNLNRIGYTKVSEIITYNYSTNSSSLAAIKNDQRCLDMLNNGELTSIGVSLSIDSNNKKYYTLILAK